MKPESTEVEVSLAGGKKITFETGKLAKQAHGSAMVRLGDNVVLAEDVKQPFTRNYGTLKVRFEGLESFVGQLVQ